MFLSTQKRDKFSIPSKLERFKDDIEGPFLSAKQKIDVNSEFQFLLKKLEKRLQYRPIDVSKDLENNSEKSDSVKGKKQLKIESVLSVEKV